MKIDTYRLKEDRRALEARIRSLKALLRTTWIEPMASSQRALLAAKREATELCILRAHLRGKLHLPDAERCKEVAQRRMLDYRAPQSEGGRGGLE